VLNAFPYSNLVKDFYNRTKDSNDILRLGLNIAESCAIAVSSPFVSKYVAVDKFAASQLERIEDRLGLDLVATSVGAVAYPIGFSLGLAGFARSKVLGLATPVVEYTYEVADMVIDQLLPPDDDETMEDEYRKNSLLQQKSPFQRIKERATFDSVIHLPSTAFLLSTNLFSSSLYICAGFASMSLNRLVASATTLINSINAQFEADLMHPWKVVYNGDLIRLYRAILFHGIRTVNLIVYETESRAFELSQYLEERNLPYNSQVFKFVASRLKWIERRLVKIGGVQLISSEGVTGTSSFRTPPRRTVKPHTRTLLYTPRKRNVPDEQRLPTIMFGDTQPAWHEHSEHEFDMDEKPAHPELHFSPPKRKTASPSKPALKSTPIVPSKLKEVHFDKPQELNKETKFNEPAQANEPKRAKKSAKVWPNESSKKFVKLAEANRKKQEEKIWQEAEIAAAKIKAARKGPVEEEENEEDLNVDEHGYAPVRAQVHGHLLRQAVAKDMFEETIDHRKQVPATPVNSPAEVLSNNPFGDILVDEDAVLRGPELEEAERAKIREHDLVAHQRDLWQRALHELVQEVGNRLEKIERRAEENAQAGPWQTAKHTVHVETEEPAAVASPVVDNNNPFAKLSTDTTEDPILEMGRSTM
jgi:hypothetical protein